MKGGGKVEEGGLSRAVLDEREELPEGCKKTLHQMIFDWKFEGWVKSCLVLGGHPPPECP